MKVKTCELIGPALDWAVAECITHNIGWALGPLYPIDLSPLPSKPSKPFRPSTDWQQAGPIIEANWKNIAAVALGWLLDEVCEPNKPTLLIFWMRCYVAYRLGSEVDIPEELL